MEASVMEGNQQDELGFVWALGWRPKEVALEQGSLLMADCMGAGKQPDELLD